MRGCDNYCAYCIVPHVRGPEQSVPAAQVVDTVRRLAATGTREVTLLGQNVNSYTDPQDNCDFPGLLRRVHEVEGLARIRFTTSHPKDCSVSLIQTVAELPKACKHIRLPVQSGSTRVLAAMNRRYTRDDYLRTIETIRGCMPDADITTDVMTGFPGETDADFADTMRLFEEMRYTQAFMFAFSPRAGTAAASMPEQVPAPVARQRLEQLIRTQTAITRRHYEQMVGKEVEVLLTERQEKRDRSWMGQDRGCKRVLVACSGELSGAILRVRVTATSGMTLLCESENP
jgi:tRNA-2-methylthio-N6-dimethylallyladenosine synthase